MQTMKGVGPCRQEVPAQVRLELSAETLSTLLNSGFVSVNNFRCLDQDSKQCVWQLLLKNLGQAS